MNSFFRIFIFFMLFAFSLNGAIYKGQNEYMKNCGKCHQSGEIFVTKYTEEEWKNFLGKDNKNLADLHLKNKKAKKSWKYFNGKRYTKKVKHLRQFVIEYAKDSGNVPVCN